MATNKQLQFVQLDVTQINCIVYSLRCAALEGARLGRLNDADGLRTTYETQAIQQYKLARQLEDLLNHA